MQKEENENLSFHRKYIRKIWYIRSKNASFFRFVFSLSSFSIFAFSILYKRRYQIRNANNEMFYSHENNLKILIMKNRFTKAIETTTRIHLGTYRRGTRFSLLFPNFESCPSKRLNIFTWTRNVINAWCRTVSDDFLLTQPCGMRMPRNIISTRTKFFFSSCN